VQTNQAEPIGANSAMRFAASLGVVVLLTAFSVVPTYAEPSCVVRDDGVNGIALGQEIDSALAALKKDFVVVERLRKDSLDPIAFLVKERSSGKTWFVLTVDRSKIVFLDIQGPCVTKERVGVGSTLGEAIKVYGRPSLSPLGGGYFVGFAAYPRLLFLLRNEDIPEALRGIPDDALSAKQTRTILAQSKARIEEMHLFSDR